jgi:hypothetical protein
MGEYDKAIESLSNIRKLAKYIYRSLSYATAMDFSIVI